MAARDTRNAAGGALHEAPGVVRRPGGDRRGGRQVGVRDGLEIRSGRAAPLGIGIRGTWVRGRPDDAG
jgi:hypothetical protein